MNELGLLLSPRELYCLGELMNASFIDYAYFAAMDDIGPSYSLFRKETLASLSAKGILNEDFNGSIELEEKYRSLLEPIFFGKRETSLDICIIDEKEVSVDVCKFHFLSDRITMVKGVDDDLLIKAVNEDYILNMVGNLLPDGYSAMDGLIADGFDNRSVTRLISAKSMDIGERGDVRVFVEACGIMYSETEEDVFTTMSANGFITCVFELVRGMRE